MVAALPPTQVQARQPPVWTAWLASLVVHLCVVIGLAANQHSHLVRGAPHALALRLAGEEAAAFDATDEESAAVGALTTELDDLPAADAAFSAIDAPADAAPTAIAAPRLMSLGLSTSNLLANSQRQTAGGGGGAGSRGRGLGRLGSDARVTIFGVEGVGSKFVFVFDHSTSMAGAPLAAAKQQLLAGIEALDSVHQFHVIFFNHQMQNWDLTGGQRRIPFASQPNKELARRFVNGVSAAGGTSRRTPLLHALAMNPDVVFFLTDADDAMPAYDVADAVRRAERCGAAVACIEFGAGARQHRENFLTQLSRETGGQYAYIDVTNLGD